MMTTAHLETCHHCETLLREHKAAALDAIVANAKTITCGCQQLFENCKNRLLCNHCGFYIDCCVQSLWILYRFNYSFSIIGVMIHPKCISAEVVHISYFLVNSLSLIIVQYIFTEYININFFFFWLINTTNLFFEAAVGRIN